MHADIGGRLRYHRTKQSMTFVKLAEAVGVTPRYLQGIWRGKTGMSLSTLKFICSVLQISSDALLFGTPTGINALLRDFEAETIEGIRELAQLQLKI